LHIGAFQAHIDGYEQRQLQTFNIEFVICDELSIAEGLFFREQQIVLPGALRERWLKLGTSWDIWER
jgi:hypothetical protein